MHTVLTDNGTHFTAPRNTNSAAPEVKAAIDAGESVWAHAFEYACARGGIDHRLTKPKHLWTNGQVERMNRALNDATIKRHYCKINDEPQTHLDHFVQAHNHARRLKPSTASPPTRSSVKSGQKTQPDTP